MGKTVVEILQVKHPEGKPLNPDALSQVNSPHSDFHPIVFEGTDTSLVCSTALKAKGSTGPSGLDMTGGVFALPSAVTLMICAMLWLRSPDAYARNM